MDKLILNLPLRVPVSKKRDFAINLNEYRNAHFLVLNKAKIVFKSLIQSQLVRLPIYDTVELEYFLFPGSLRDMDIGNICSIADKFFSDALVESGKLMDDCYRYIPKTTYAFAEVDKINPRVEVHITGIIKEEKVFIQASLDNSDFYQALEDYVRKHYPIPEGLVPGFDITAGRGDKGYTAIVSFDTDPNIVMKNKPMPADELQASLQGHGNVMNRLDDGGIPKPLKAAPTALLDVMERPKEVPSSEPEENTDQASPEVAQSAPMERPQPSGSPLVQEPKATAPAPTPVAAKKPEPLFAKKAETLTAEQIGGADDKPEPSTKPVFNFGQ